MRKHRGNYIRVFLRRVGLRASRGRPWMLPASRPRGRPHPPGVVRWSGGGICHEVGGKNLHGNTQGLITVVFLSSKIKVNLLNIKRIQLRYFKLKLEKCIYQQFSYVKCTFYKIHFIYFFFSRLAAVFITRLSKQEKVAKMNCTNFCWKD